MRWESYAHFSKKIQGKDLTVTTVGATLLTARFNQAIFYAIFPVAGGITPLCRRLSQKTK